MEDHKYSLFAGIMKLDGFTMLQLKPWCNSAQTTEVRLQRDIVPGASTCVFKFSPSSNRWYSRDARPIRSLRSWPFPNKMWSGWGTSDTNLHFSSVSFWLKLSCSTRFPSRSNVVYVVRVSGIHRGCVSACHTTVAYYILFNISKGSLHMGYSPVVGKPLVPVVSAVKNVQTQFVPWRWRERLMFV